MVSPARHPRLLRAATLALLASFPLHSASAPPAPYDLSIISFSDRSCSPATTSFEMTLAGGGCMRTPRMAISHSCSLDGHVRRQVWRRSKGGNNKGLTGLVECTGPPTDDTYDSSADSACLQWNIFGGKSNRLVCLNTRVSRASGTVQLRSFSGAARSSVCDATTATWQVSIVVGTCYDIEADGRSSLRFACAKEGTEVHVESYAGHSRCGGGVTTTTIIPSGTCLPPGHAANPGTASVTYTCGGATQSVSYSMDDARQGQREPQQQQAQKDEAVPPPLWAVFLLGFGASTLAVVLALVGRKRCRPASSSSAVAPPIAAQVVELEPSVGEAAEPHGGRGAEMMSQLVVVASVAPAEEQLDAKFKAITNGKAGTVSEVGGAGSSSTTSPR